MKFKEVGTCSRFTALALMVLMTGFAARASIIEPTATLPPPAGVYDLPLICITPVCLVNAEVSNFNTTSDNLTMAGEVVTTTAVFSAEVFQNNSGVPGADLGPVSITGTMDFTYFGRSLSIPLGTFNAQITGFDFAGTFNGHPFEVEQNPSQSSTGTTTINQVSGGYQVDSFFDVFAQLSINGGPFVPGPDRPTTLTDVPEPGSAGFALMGLLGLVGVGSRALRRIR